MTMQRGGTNPLLNPNDDSATRDAKNIGYASGVAWQPLVPLLRRIEALEKRVTALEPQV